MLPGDKVCDIERQYVFKCVFIKIEFSDQPSQYIQGVPKKKERHFEHTYKI